MEESYYQGLKQGKIGLKSHCGSLTCAILLSIMRLTPNSSHSNIHWSFPARGPCCTGLNPSLPPSVRAINSDSSQVISEWVSLCLAVTLKAGQVNIAGAPGCIPNAPPLTPHPSTPSHYSAPAFSCSPRRSGTL